MRRLAPLRGGEGLSKRHGVAGGGQVTAVAYDNPIPGFNTSNTINLRLWAAKPDTEFDLEAFNTGDYVQVRAYIMCPSSRAAGAQSLRTCRNGTASPTAARRAR